MAQRLITLCDAHMERGDDSAGGLQWTVAITAPGAREQAYVVDLCDDDGQPLRELLEFLGRIGRKAEQAPRKVAAKSGGGARSGVTARTDAPAPADTGPVPCPVDGCTAVPSSRKALTSHLRAYHDGLSIAAAYGQPEPFKCPECGQTSKNPQGLGAHRRAAHGVTGTSKQ